MLDLLTKIMQSSQCNWSNNSHTVCFQSESDEKRNDDLILKLKKDIKENCEMLTEYSSDTPIIAGMKARLDMSDQGFEFHFKKSL